jgi:hypothetical protein
LLIEKGHGKKSMRPYNVTGMQKQANKSK